MFTKLNRLQMCGCHRPMCGLWLYALHKFCKREGWQPCNSSSWVNQAAGSKYLTRPTHAHSVHPLSDQF
eukprot:6329557-Amphidinium_carterae.1